MAYTRPGPDSHTAESMHLSCYLIGEGEVTHISKYLQSRAIFIPCLSRYQSVRDPANLKGCVARDSGRFSCDLWGDAFVMPCLHH